MSTRPHIVLSWTVRRTRPPLLPLSCVDCHSGLARTGDGKFRVNASGKLVDIRLLVACVSCDRTSKITAHDRVPVRYLDPIRLQGCSGNSSAAESQNPQGLLIRPALSRRRGPEPGREARWPRPGLHHAAVRAGSPRTARERRSGSARYRRGR
ncbi:DUF1062 domain-containing protein [Micromonospora purpureochromogenes]|uniref:DUF1062 domain-containing protein n=1 Tax=Micromonospora purpureochromogenes TaxID=47872 RepID=UPI0033FBA088